MCSISWKRGVLYLTNHHFDRQPITFFPFFIFRTGDWLDMSCTFLEYTMSEIMPFSSTPTCLLFRIRYILSLDHSKCTHFCVSTKNPFRVNHARCFVVYHRESSLSCCINPMINSEDVHGIVTKHMNLLGDSVTVLLLLWSRRWYQYQRRVLSCCCYVLLSPTQYVWSV